MYSVEIMIAPNLLKYLYITLLAGSSSLVSPSQFSNVGKPGAFIPKTSKQNAIKYSEIKKHNCKISCLL